MAHPTLLQRDKARLKTIRATSICLRGGAYKQEDDMLAVFRYRMVEECANVVGAEIKALRTAMAQAPNNPSIPTQIAALERAQAYVNNLRDEARFGQLPAELRAVAW